MHSKKLNINQTIKFPFLEAFSTFFIFIFNSSSSYDFVTSNMFEKCLFLFVYDFIFP